MVRLVVDAETCIGSAQCVATAPDVVELDANGTAVILVTQLERELAEQLRDLCPMSALSVETG